MLEIVFLLDLLQGDGTLIERWRCADEMERKKKFWPAPVRLAQAVRSRSKENTPDQYYKLFSELAGHPTTKSMAMIRPRQEDDAHCGPFC